MKIYRTTFRLGIKREFLDYLTACKCLKKESVSVTHFHGHDIECAKHCSSLETLSEFVRYACPHREGCFIYSDLLIAKGMRIANMTHFT